ncbi:PB1 domain [Dillenia turbinata]|uniref:PB1 domain n=1 Tax=Dillenia turbinata TaxID=194707 RepID=A0AAN8USJ7_9MAGN
MAGEGERSAHSSAGNSPKGRVKFMCSYGGKILPRPGDGVLKYVGGETRIVAVPRDITYSELMKKLGDMIDGDNMIVKYQIFPEELDALVSVKSDEDLRHMLDEYERQECKGTPKLRAFLFPANPPVVIENQTASSADQPLQLEQRYIDAVNGIVHARYLRSASFRPTHSIFTFSNSASSSPKSNSPDAHTGHGIDPFSHGAVLSGGQTKTKLPMHKVHSSPSLFSPHNPEEPQNSSNPIGNFHPHHHYPPYYRSHQHQHHHHVYQDFRPLDSQRPFSGLQPMSRNGHSRGHWCQSPNYINNPTRESAVVDASVHHQNPCVDGRTFEISSSPPQGHRMVIWE